MVPLPPQREARVGANNVRVKSKFELTGGWYPPLQIGIYGDEEKKLVGIETGRRGRRPLRFANQFLSICSHFANNISVV